VHVRLGVHALPPRRGNLKWAAPRRDELEGKMFMHEFNLWRVKESNHSHVNKKSTFGERDP
jgi:hypothetical protein